MVHDLDDALLLLNGWLGRPVQLPVLIRNGAPPGELPPSQPSPRWHVMLGRKARVGRPKLAEATDLERQLTVGTYEQATGRSSCCSAICPTNGSWHSGRTTNPTGSPSIAGVDGGAPSRGMALSPQAAAFLAGGSGRPRRATRSWLHSQRLWFGPSPLDHGQPVASLEPGDGIE